MPKIIAKKEDWIILGYKLFSEKGINGIVVEKMALKLNVNKSSFYWHFKTKKDFVNEIISFWISVDTNKIITRVESKPLGKEKFKELGKSEKDVVVFALTDDSYKALSLSVADLRRYIVQQNAVIKAYKEYYEPVKDNIKKK